MDKFKQEVEALVVGLGLVVTLPLFMTWFELFLNIRYSY